MIKNKKQLKIFWTDFLLLFQVDCESTRDDKQETLNSYNVEDMELEDCFTFTGLLEGQFDTLYTPNTSKIQVKY
jgi:hypothetical protein